jgi:hypothetical protein
LAIYNFGRFRIGMMPVWLMFVGLGVTWSWQRLLSPNRGRDWRRAAVALTSALALSATSFLAIHPQRYRVDECREVGRLANDGGAYGLAEHELRRALALLDQADLPGETKAFSTAADELAIRAELVRTFAGTGRYAEAASEIRLALTLPAPDPIREATYFDTAVVLHMAVSDVGAGQDGAVVRGELRRLLAALHKIRPDSLPYAALYCLYAVDGNDVSVLRRQLDAAWQRRSPQTPASEGQGWYRFGRAALADFTGNREEAATWADRALTAWPQHPFEKDLRRIQTR